MRSRTSSRSSTASSTGWRTSRTTPVHHGPFGAAGQPCICVVVTSVPLVALLEPGVAVVVVAVALPEALLVVVEQGQPGHPLRALPEVEVWHQQPDRTAVLSRQRPAVVGPHHPGLAVSDVRERQV